MTIKNDEDARWEDEQLSFKPIARVPLSAELENAFPHEGPTTHAQGLGPPTLEAIFDDQAYLRENPDVEDAVKAGQFTSGLDHFMKFGGPEGRPGPPTFRNPQEYAFPAELPPTLLRKRVHGTAHTWTFERVGSRVAQEIVRATRPWVDLASARVLDFGCGCGRVAAYLKSQSAFDLTASDIDGEAIGWCQANLSHLGRFVQNDVNPPLPFADGAFDLVYCVSVFTHLPEAMQDVWLRELHRVTRRGGIVLISTRDIGGLPHSLRERMLFRVRGFTYRYDGGTQGLPKFYQVAFHSQRYIRRRWGRAFEILGTEKQGINGDQDLTLLRRPASGAAARQRVAERITGR